MNFATVVGRRGGSFEEIFAGSHCFIMRSVHNLPTTDGTKPVGSALKAKPAADFFFSIRHRAISRRLDSSKSKCEKTLKFVDGIDAFRLF
ncbi:hypothetical protein NPIL_494381 [Nephila pilipes]|uniref:Uncharacterized protein n=1 Tax=Nephila pilipes TaxID=299642 RepID=A0A8X6TZ62_NEPPI|nr:hypothetical protein NPIL_494381 [Nephila pilipes]